MNPKISVVVPVLGRPGNAQPLADSFRAASTVAELWFVTSPGDDAQVEACFETGYPAVMADWPAGPGDFARKINRAVRVTRAPWIFQGADDIRFHPGWDTALLACAERTGALVIGTQDGGNPSVKVGRHSTHTLIARAYIGEVGASMDGPGSVFSTAYGHQYCDVELVELAKARGVWAFCDEARVEHLHPFWHGRDRMDATYEKGLASSRADERVFRTRERLWKRPARV